MSKTANPTYKIIRDGDEKIFEDKQQFEDTRDLLNQNDVDFDVEVPDNPASEADSESEESEDAELSDEAKRTAQAEVVKETDEKAAEAVESSAEPTTTETVEPAEPKGVDPAELSKDPIGFLRSVNQDFVNTIKGKPAISKQGFRFIQREFEISTKSEVVQWSDDPVGCVVWAKAELPGGYSAEAHGEGYQFESDVSDNEFVRYADTRAKNRAISDLTSAGALAVSELQPEQ